MWLMNKNDMKIILILSLAFLAMNCKPNLSNKKVTVNRIKAIKLDMSIDQVIDLIGLPYEIKAKWYTHEIFRDPASKNNHFDVPIKEINKKEDITTQINIWRQDTTYCCQAYKNDQSTRGYTFAYSNHNVSFQDYPMVWIHFDTEIKVDQVYVKRYEGIGWDSFEVYSLSNWGKVESSELDILFK
jgi:hypothetical protein